MKHFLLALFFPCLAIAQDPPSSVRVSLPTDVEIWSGQRVPLTIELLAPGFFTSSPVFDLPSVSGIWIIPPTGSPTISSQETDGVSYTVQRHELAVVARTSGKVEIPPFHIRFSIKRHPLDRDSTPQSVLTPALSFKAAAPPGIAPGEWILTSADMMVTETWKPEVQPTVKPGAAYVRTLTWKASDLPSMAFPPFKPMPVEHLGIYVAEPEVSDHRDREAFQASRVETITYVCKTGGHAIIPATSMHWWDPTGKEMRQVTFPARVLTIAGMATPAAPGLDRWFLKNWQTVVGCLLGMTAVWYFRHPLKIFFRHFLPHHLPPLNP